LFLPDKPDEPEEPDEPDSQINQMNQNHLSSVGRRFFGGVGLSFARFLKATSAPNALSDHNKTHQISK